MSYPSPGQVPSQPAWGAPPPPPPSFGGPNFGYRLPGLASYPRRVMAFVIDVAVMSILVVVSVVVLLTGPTDIVRCNLDSDGGIVVFDLDEDTRPGLCEQPTAGAWVTASFVLFLAVVAWFLYHAWEGATGKSVGKLIMGIRVVEETTMEPIGGWAGIGRGAVEAGLGVFTCGIAGLVDLLFPLWDDKRQTLHDKALSSVVVEAGYQRPKGSALAHFRAPPPGSPVDPFGR